MRTFAYKKIKMFIVGGRRNVMFSQPHKLSKKMNSKKMGLQAFLVAILLMVGNLLANAETVNVGGVNYNLNHSDMTAEVAEYNKVSGDIVLPASLSYGGQIYTLTTIGGDAFNYCESLTSITMPNGVTSIGEGAFYGCENLTSIAIPASVVSIGKEAFADCISLTSMKVESGNKVYDSREECNAIIETATNKLVMGCKTSVVPFGITSIGDEAFYKCGTLASITLPESVTSIGEYAFYKCFDLASINLPEGLTSIGESTFWRCGKLTTLTIPAKVAFIGEGAFYECPGLGSISVASGNKVYDSREGCNAIIETATNKLIAGCKTSVIPQGVTSIGDDAFEGCDITSVTLPEGIVFIGRSAFSECLALTSVSLPESLTSIGGSAFSYCSNLKDVYCYGTEKKEIGGFEFSEIASDAVLHVHGSLLEAYKTDGNWSGSFSNIVALPGTETGITQVVIDTIDSCHIYTIDGKQVPSLQRGINILHTTDGKSIKIAK